MNFKCHFKGRKKTIFPHKPMGLFPKKVFCSLSKPMDLFLNPWAYFFGSFLSFWGSSTYESKHFFFKIGPFELNICQEPYFCMRNPKKMATRRSVDFWSLYSVLFKVILDPKILKKKSIFSHIVTRTSLPKKYDPSRRYYVRGLTVYNLNKFFMR
jgi:hypothetical protein